MSKPKKFARSEAVTLMEAIEFAKTRTIERYQPRTSDFYDSVIFTDGSQVISRPNNSDITKGFWIAETNNQ